MNRTYSIEKIVRPGELDEARKQVLAGQLVPVTRDGFGTEVTVDDITRHVLGVDVLYLALERDRLVGFGSFEHLHLAGEDVLYLCGTVFAREHQCHGLMSSIIDRAVKESGMQFIATRTQNPILYVALSRRCSKLYPNGNSGIPPEPFRTVAAELAKHLKMRGFDPESLTEIGTYGGCMTDRPPHYGGPNSEAARRFAGFGLMPERGDSVILVGRTLRPD